MATYGKIGEIKELEESWTLYVERLEQYLLANEVEDFAKRGAILLSVCGSKTYALARDFLQPVWPAKTTGIETKMKELQHTCQICVSSMMTIILAIRYQKCYEIGW